MATVLQSVAFTTKTSAATTESVSITGVTTGSTLVAIYSAYQNNQPNPIVSSVDIGGNLFTLAARRDRGLDDFEIGMFYLPNLSSGNKTVDFNLNAPSSTVLNMTVLELSGVPTTSPLSAVVTAYNTNVAPNIAISSGTLPSSDCLLVGVCGTSGNYASDINFTATANLGTPIDIREQPNGGNVGCYVVKLVPSSTASHTITFDHEDAIYGNMAILAIFLNESSPQRFKFYTDSGAQGDSGVSAIVWEDNGVDIVGTKYIEDTGLSFQGTLDSGRSVLYVSCSSGLGLANGTVVKGIAYNGTNTTGLMSGVVEAGSA